jgi:xylitol oxidase
MRNWAGNYEYRARQVHEPVSVEALQELVWRSPRIRAIGSRHSFNAIADSDGDLVSLAKLPRVFEIEAADRTVTVDGAVRYGDVCGPLDAAGLAFHNLASLPHVSVAGACATATHGSGERSANLSTAVRSMSIVRADGELMTIDRDADPTLWQAAAVSLGTLGVVTRLTLDVEPSYRVRQDVYEDLPLGAFAERFDDVIGLGDSVSFFTQWRSPAIDQVWVKRRMRGRHSDDPPAELFGARRATAERHPIPGLSPVACTPQLGLPGPWHERLPHFRLDYTPSSGDELQSEYFVAREDGVPAFLALDEFRDWIAPLIQVSEVRTIAKDDLWLSPAFDRASVAFHFTWRPDWPSVRVLLPRIEAALAQFAPRPHWAKLFVMHPEDVGSRYERLSDFQTVARRFDPDGKFRNEFLDRHVFAEHPRG